MNEQAFRELLDVVSIESDGFNRGVRLRKNAMLQWIDSWVDQLSSEQYVLNYNKLPSQYQDELKERLALQIVEAASQNARYDISHNSVHTTMYVLRRTKRNNS